KTSFYQVYANSAEGLVAAPKAAAVPVDLRNGPLALIQPGRANAAPTQAPAPAAPRAPARQRATDAPPIVQLGAGRPLEIPVQLPLGGRVVVTDANGVPLAASFANE